MSVNRISSANINKITQCINEKYNSSEKNSIFPIDKLNNFFESDAFYESYDMNGDGSIDDEEVEAILKDIENNSGIMTLAFGVSGENSIAAVPNTTKDAANTNGDKTIEDAFEQIYANKSAQELIDINNDGNLSVDEKELFENYIKGDSLEDLTVEDLEKILSDIEGGTFNYEPEEEIPDYEAVGYKGPEEKVANKTGSSASAKSSRPNSSSYSPKSSYDNTNNPNANNITNVDNMSLEELQGEKTKREGEVTKAREAVNDVNNGNNANVAAAQNEYESAKEAYETAVENDENISEDLKNQQSENLQEIETTQGEIDDYNIQINDTKGEISDTESAISADKANIGALESALASLNSYDSDDEEKMQEVAAKKTQLTNELNNARAQKTEHEEQLVALNGDLETLEGELADKKSHLEELEAQRTEIEAQILENCGEETKAALEAFNQAKTNIDTVKESELSSAEANLQTAEAALKEVNEAINVKEAKQTERSYSVNDLEDFEKLYETLGLEDEGLNFEVFSLAMEGYLNLDDKGNGYLGIFDTTQASDAERYYLLNLNDFELVERSVLKTGSGNMDDIKYANQHGSHATLSGFEKIGEEYYSTKMGKKALKIYGLEEGINNNAYAKGTVVHYTEYNSTYGCKGFPPVYANGGIDLNATYERMYDLFPPGTIIFTCPTYADQYKNLSSLYA